MVVFYLAYVLGRRGKERLAWTGYYCILKLWRAEGSVWRDLRG